MFYCEEHHFTFSPCPTPILETPASQLTPPPLPQNKNSSDLHDSRKSPILVSKRFHALLLSNTCTAREGGGGGGHGGRVGDLCVGVIRIFVAVAAQILSHFILYIPERGIGVCVCVCVCVCVHGSVIALVPVMRNNTHCKYERKRARYELKKSDGVKRSGDLHEISKI